MQSKNKTRHKSDQKKVGSKLSENEKNLKKTFSLRWLVLGLAIFLFFGLIACLIWDLTYASRVSYGVKLGNYDVGGMTAVELDGFFSDRLEEMRDEIILVNGDEELPVKLGDLGVWIELDKCRQDVFGHGKELNIFIKQLTRLQALFGRVSYNCDFNIDDFNYNEWTAGLRETVNKPAISATIEKSEGDFRILPASEGLVVDEKKLRSDLEINLSGLNFAPISLTKVVEVPEVTDEMAEDTLNKTKKTVDQSQLQFVYKEFRFSASREDLYDWVGFSIQDYKGDKNVVGYKSNKNNIVLATFFDMGKLGEFITDNAWEFEIQPKNAKLKMTENGPEIINEGEGGLMVDRLELVDFLNNRVGTTLTNVDLPVKEMGAMVSADSIDGLGIKELIGTGISDFSGSPGNRIHNIGVGAEQFNGTVIAPGEEFSFTTRLGPVNAYTGYLPELVIADDETRPEYGGGLCQVSTTVYRAALDSGFPITDRSPHQYRVVYYEPAGMDATIYIPNPDLKFINDTKHYVLIEAYVSGSSLVFNFYGTNDGRQVELTEPVIYNITSPPPAKYIYTSSLPAGETIQVDIAHYGADSIFNRYITYADGTKKEEEFFSRYQAWPAKFKVGEGEVIVEPEEEKTDIDVDGETDLSRTA